MNVFGIGINSIKLAIIVVNNSGYILFNALPMLFRDNWHSHMSCEYKMDIKIMEFDFHFIVFDKRIKFTNPKNRKQVCQFLPYPTTMFTIFFGTTITFLGGLPSSHFAASGAARAIFSTSAGDVSAGISSLKRVLPLKETG